jgi:hypothetical protein
LLVPPHREEIPSVFETTPLFILIGEFGPLEVLKTVAEIDAAEFVEHDAEGVKDLA